MTKLPVWVFFVRIKWENALKYFTSWLGHLESEPDTQLGYHCFNYFPFYCHSSWILTVKRKHKYGFLFILPNWFLVYEKSFNKKIKEDIFWSHSLYKSFSSYPVRGWLWSARWDYIINTLELFPKPNLPVGITC